MLVFFSLIHLLFSLTDSYYYYQIGQAHFYLFFAAKASLAGVCASLGPRKPQSLLWLPPAGVKGRAAAKKGVSSMRPPVEGFRHSGSGEHALDFGLHPAVHSGMHTTF